MELTGCKPGLCYSFQDVSYLETPMDAQMYRLCDDNLCQYRGNTSAQPPEYYSVFQDIRAAEGASQSYFSRWAGHRGQEGGGFLELGAPHPVSHTPLPQFTIFERWVLATRAGAGAPMGSRI